MEFNFSDKPEEGNHHHQDGSFSTAGAGGLSSTATAPPPSFLPEGKLLLKLRLPKSGEGTEESSKMVDGSADSDSPSSVRKRFSHYCSECNKGFSSGKALGGHMSSAHVQARDNFKKLKIKKSDRFYKRDGSTGGNGEEEEEEDGGGNLSICVICGKDFPSTKSLCGHMRCHPEREWRGILPPTSREETARKALPPPPRPRPGLVDYDDDDEADGEYSDGFKEFKEENHKPENLDNVFGDSAHDRDGLKQAAVDLTRSLSSWVVTGKRGRESLKKTLELDFDNEEERKRVYDAVDQLIRLVNGDSWNSNNEEEKESMSRNNSSTPSEDLKCGKEFPAKKRKFYSEIADEDVDSEETLDGGMVKIKANVAAGALMGSESSVEKSQNSAEYSKDSDGLCLECHENNHVTADREELDSMKIDVMKDDRNVVMGKMIKGNVHKKVKGEMTPDQYHHHDHKHKCHKCRTCKKIFPSPQALGGHMASHNKVKVHVHNTVDDHRSSAIGFSGNDCKARLVELQGIQVGSRDDSKGKDGIYACEICQKTFSSGRALGGHKRCHYGYASATSQAASGKPARKVLEFDLNVALEEDPNC